MTFGLTKQLQRLILYIALAFMSILLVAKAFGLFDQTFHPAGLYNSLTGSKTDRNNDKPVIIDIEFRVCSHVFTSKGNCEPLASWRDNDVEKKEIPVVWERIPKDLYLGKKWFKEGYIFQKTISSLDAQASQIKTVNDIAIENPLNEKKVSGNENNIPLKIIKEYQKVIKNTNSEMVIPTIEQTKSMGWKRKKFGLWIKYGSLSIAQSLTGINALFGQDCVDPRPDWKLTDSPLRFNLKDKDSGGKASDKQGSHDNDGDVYITIRKGLATKLSTPSFKLTPKNGKFKILQVADLHFSTGYGKCRDPWPELAPGDDCLADTRTLKFIDSVLEFEQPDLVVLTGDQVFGEDSQDSQTTIFKACAPFVKAHIPFAMTFGNHDDEGSMDRETLMRIVKFLPYSVSIPGPEKVTGVGNYYLTITSEENSKTVAGALYFLDSHKYSQQPKVKGYDFLKNDQLEYVMSVHEDLAHAKTNLSPLQMAFFHIPLPEYRDFKNSKGEARTLIGSYKEGVTAPYYNTGMMQLLYENGVKVVSVGHDHCNDYCMKNDIWLCYGGASGEGGYAGYGGTTRRMRIYELDFNEQRITTWKRLETAPAKVFDEQALVDGGELA